MKRTSLIITIAIGVFALIGGLWTFDQAYTRAERTDKLEIKLAATDRRIDRKILEDQAQNLRRRMWDLERYYGPDKAKQLREYRELKAEREAILRKLR